MYFKEIKNIVVFALFTTLLCNCRKYRDDENISFKTPFKRIVGHWQIDYFFVNFQDSSYHIYSTNAVYYNNYQYNLKDLQFEFKSQTSITAYVIEDGNSNFYGPGNPNNRTAQGVWKLNDINKSVIIDGFDFEYRVPLGTSWQIIKLTDTEFHVQTNYNGNVYEIYFKKY